MFDFPSVLESVNDLNNEQVIKLFSLAEAFEQNKILFTEENSLKKPVIYTLFLENSTRTKLSFATCAQRLGAHYLDFSIHTSSMNKGESLEETLNTLNAQGAELCIIRSSDTHLLKKFKENPPLKLINGGDGIHEHPTQALLDFYLLTKIYREKLPNMTLGIAGDIVHSRVAHSLIELLPRFGVKLALFGPDHFIPKNLQKNIIIYQNKKEFIKSVDLIYLLRIQLERHDEKNSIDKNHYLKEFGFTKNELDEQKKSDIKILHPGPVNEGIELDLELLKSNYYLGLRQVEVSIPVRMAILLSMVNNNKLIGKNAKKFTFKSF